MTRDRAKPDSGKSSAKRRWRRLGAVLGTLTLAAVTAVVADLATRGADKILSPKGGTLVSYSSAPLEPDCGVVTYLPDPVAQQVLGQLAPQSFRAIEDEPGAAPAGTAVVEASIQGASARAITITRITFKVNRLPLPPGATFTQPCGGPLIGRAIEVDLDTSPPRIIGTNASPEAFLGEKKEAYRGRLKVRPITFPWTVSLTEPLQLYLIATTKACYCGWQAELEWVSGSKRGTILISNHGRNYMIAGAYGVPSYLASAGETWQATARSTQLPSEASGAVK